MGAIWQSPAEIQNFGNSVLRGFGPNYLGAFSRKIAVKTPESRKGQMNAASDRDIVLNRMSRIGW
jgi:hypothetical protein